MAASNLDTAVAVELPPLKGSGSDQLTTINRLLQARDASSSKLDAYVTIPQGGDDKSPPKEVSNRRYFQSTEYLLSASLGCEGYKISQTGAAQPNLHAKNFSGRGTRHDRIVYPNDWIDFRVYDYRLLSIYSKKDRKMLEETNLLSDLERGEFIRFYDCLFLWEHFVPRVEEPYPADWYWENAIRGGPDFADKLKDIFAASYRRTYGVNWINSLEVPEHKIWTYNDIFPYHALLKFRPVVNDYIYSLIEPADLEIEDQEDLELEIETALAEIDEIEIISQFEIAAETSTSSCLVDEKTLKTNNHCFVEDTTFSKVMVGKRCVVHVYPGGSRDTVILTKSSSNTTKWLERQFRHILEDMPESGQTLRASTFETRLNQIQRYKAGDLHFLRDIKKCGLTFPIQKLIPTLRTCLKRRFDHPIWDYLSIYEDRRIYGYNPDDPHYPTNPGRGYCLGMANHIATFFFIIIYRISVKRFLEFHPDAEIEFSAIIGNDDADIRLRPIGSEVGNEDYCMMMMKEFVDIHALALSSFGVWYNAKKSFVSRNSLFYEEYTVSGFQYKESRYAATLASCISMPEIRLSKQLLKSFLQSCPNINQEVLINMMSYVVPIVGIEFDPEEVGRDYWLGGWIPKRTNFQSDCLFDLEQESNIPRLRRIFETIHELEMQPSATYEPEPDRSNPLCSALGLKGALRGTAASVGCSRAQKNRIYKKLILKSRSVIKYKSHILNVRRKYSSIKYKDNIYDLCERIVQKIDCNIPRFLVKEETSNTRPVSSDWLGNPDQEFANRIVKAVIYQIYSGQVSSDYEFPCRDEWRFINLQNKVRDVPKLEHNFTLIPKKEEILNFSNDGLLSCHNYLLRYGVAPESVLINLPDRNIPKWRTDEMLRGLVPKNLDTIFDEVLDLEEEEPPDLNLFGIQKVCYKEDSVISEHDTIDYTPLEPEPPPKIIKRLHPYEWLEYYEHPERIDEIIDIRCKEHTDTYEQPMIPTLHCLICQVWTCSPNTYLLANSEERERRRSEPTAEEFLSKLGFEVISTSALDNMDDEEGGLFDMFG